MRVFYDNGIPVCIAKKVHYFAEKRKIDSNIHVISSYKGPRAWSIKGLEAKLYLPPYKKDFGLPAPKAVSCTDFIINHELTHIKYHDSVANLPLIIFFVMAYVLSTHFFPVILPIRLLFYLAQSFLVFLFFRLIYLDKRKREIRADREAYFSVSIKQKVKALIGFKGYHLLEREYKIKCNILWRLFYEFFHSHPSSQERMKEIENYLGKEYLLNRIWANLLLYTSPSYLYFIFRE